jgi:hypothetical protein
VNDLSFSIDRICAEYFDGLVGRRSMVRKKEQSETDKDRNWRKKELRNKKER